MVKAEAKKHNPPPEQKPAKGETVSHLQPLADRQSQSAEPKVKNNPESNPKITVLAESHKLDKGKPGSPDETISGINIPSSDPAGGKHTIPAGSSEPREPLIMPESRVAETSQNSSPHNAGPGVKADAPTPGANGSVAGKETESTMNTKQPTETGKPSSGQTGAKQEPGKSVLPETKETDGGQKSRGQRMTADGLSDLFAKSTVEESDASRLALEMDDVDVKDLLKEGSVLVEKMRKQKA